MNILIYGGTFDPIHEAHLAILAITKKQFKINKTIIVPCKNVVYKKIDADQMHRFNMLKLAIKNIQDVEISDFEIKQTTDSPSYSIETIKHLKTLYPNDHFYFLIGADQLAYFSQWKDYEKISTSCQLLVYQRDSIEIDLLLTLHHAMPVYGEQFTLSSSMLKQNLLANDGLNKDVFNYILNNGLYTQYWIPKYMCQERYEHSIRVASLAKQIMQIYDTNLINEAWVAGIYHDIAKEFKYEKSAVIAKELNLMHIHPKIWHGPIASHYLKSLGFDNKHILNAITRHTLPMIIDDEISLLDKVIYCSDKLETSRTNDDLNNIEYYRQLVTTNIDECYNKMVAYYDVINKGKV